MREVNDTRRLDVLREAMIAAVLHKLESNEDAQIFLRDLMEYCPLDLIVCVSFIVMHLLHQDGWQERLYAPTIIQFCISKRNEFEARGMLFPDCVSDLSQESTELLRSYTEYLWGLMRPVRAT